MRIQTAQGRLVDVNSDYTRTDGWVTFTPDEHAVWDILFQRQVKHLEGRACAEFFDGIAALDLARPGIPDFAALNDRLYELTEWRIVPVPDLVPDLIFFEHLAKRELPIGNFIRTRAELDYIQEPDIFHDLFGHVPMLAHPVYADYVAAFGRAGVAAAEAGHMERMARLYWYSVEFGLVETADGPRLYGAGIASSPGETRYSIEDPSPHRLYFDITRVMRTGYRVDDFQLSYFVNRSWEELKEATSRDLTAEYKALAGTPDLHPGRLYPKDDIFAKGTQAYARAKGQLMAAE